jgi:hypothetical protein
MGIDIGRIRRVEPDPAAGIDTQPPLQVCQAGDRRDALPFPDIDSLSFSNGRSTMHICADRRVIEEVVVVEDREAFDRIVEAVLVE